MKRDIERNANCRLMAQRGLRLLAIVEVVRMYSAIASPWKRQIDLQTEQESGKR